MPTTSSTYSISEFNGFFRRFEQKTHQLESKKIEEHKEGFTQLLKGYNNKREDTLERLKHIADEYNIFDVLGVKTLETVTHSPFIANLLNPKGTHAQRSLFYRSFIETIYSKEVQQKLLNISEEDIEVVTEKSTPDGFIDIFIQHHNLNNPFCIIIENKIYAGDQYKQLRRYYDFAINILNMRASDIFLIYLKNGTGASKDSMNFELQNKLKSTQQLVNISYSEQMTAFLNSTSNDILALPVKEVVKQYLTTIQKLGL